MKTVEVVLFCLVLSVRCSGIFQACFSLCCSIPYVGNISSYPFSAVEIKQALRQWREWMVD
jgi:hypothetical protein